MITIKEREGGKGVVVKNDEGEIVIEDESSRIIIIRNTSQELTERDIIMLSTTIPQLLDHAKYWKENYYDKKYPYDK